MYALIPVESINASRSRIQKSVLSKSSGATQADRRIVGRLSPRSLRRMSQLVVHGEILLSLSMRPAALSFLATLKLRNIEMLSEMGQASAPGKGKLLLRNSRAWSGSHNWVYFPRLSTCTADGARLYHGGLFLLPKISAYLPKMGLSSACTAVSSSGHTTSHTGFQHSETGRKCLVKAGMNSKHSSTKKVCLNKNYWYTAIQNTRNSTENAMHKRCSLK